NTLVPEARGEILLFTDARQEFAPDALRRIVENFYDPSVGAVSGELELRPAAGEGVGRGMGLYWKYEKALRKWEAAIGSLLGATGAIYAVRKTLFSRLPVDMRVDDMYVPFRVI